MHNDVIQNNVFGKNPYDGSYLTNTVYALPNGNRFSVKLQRDPGRRNLVTRRDHTFNGSSIYWYSTGFDLLGRPTNAVDSISIARTFLYNRRNELAAAQIGTNSYGYAYDTIGNRMSDTFNGMSRNYAANCLNQYSAVNRTIEQSEQSNNFTYDAEGNLVHDDRFAYSYDAENRLITVVPRIPVEGSFSVENRYSHKNLRVRKIVRRYTDGEWMDYATHDFTYDGGNIVLERITFADGTTHTCEYFWGNDLSGTEQGAGGVGGLVAVSVDGSFFIPCYDHNGNIVCYVSESGTIAAQYVYDPYGNVIEQYGSNPSLFNFGFSTKYHDREIGMLAYQRRFYRPDHGRWLNRDPIEEEGGENLYAFCFSNPITYYDTNGTLVIITGPLLMFPLAPNWWDQLGSGTGPFNEEQWFEDRYPHLLAEARQRFTKEINNGIDCCKNVFDGKSSRIDLNPGAAGDWPWQSCVGGDDSRFGDDGQSSWEAVALLGKFSIDYVTPVHVNYSCENGKRTYFWTTTMYVDDVLGLQGDEGWFGKYFGWAAKSRRVKRAQWTLSGSGVCK